MGSVLSQIGVIFSSPLGLTVLALAILASVAVLLWAFWGRNDIPTRSNIVTHPTKIVPPPVLAPSVFIGGASPVVAKEFTLRNIILGSLGVVAIGVAVTSVMGRDDRADSYVRAGDKHSAGAAWVDADISESPYQRAAYTSPSSNLPSGVLSAVATSACEQGFVDLETNAYAYRVCADGQAARFDRIDFSRKGAPLLNATWSKTSGYTVYADNQPAPFTFDEHVTMRAAPEGSLNEYDAYVAIGLSDGSLTADADPARMAAERAYSLGRYALNTLRGEVDADCRSKATVYAISVGHPNEGAAVSQVRPVMLGIKFDDRYATADRDVNGAVAAFLRSRGTEITGYDLAKFSSRDVLFAETACPRLF